MCVGNKQSYSLEILQWGPTPDEHHRGSSLSEQYIDSTTRKRYGSVNNTKALRRANYTNTEKFCVAEH